MSADTLALLIIDTINSENIQVSADKVGKKNQFDLVELAEVVSANVVGVVVWKSLKVLEMVVLPPRNAFLPL